MSWLPIIATYFSAIGVYISAIALHRTIKRDFVSDKDKRDARRLFLNILSGVRDHSGGEPFFEPKTDRDQFLYELLVDQNRLKRGHLLENLIQ